MVQAFEILPHTADLKIRVYGESLEDLFCNAVIGMFQSIRPKSPLCKYQNDRLICSELPIKRSIFLESADEHMLLIDFLSEALVLSDIHNEAYLKVSITQLSKTSIKAALHGVPIEGFEVVEIKAVTFHDFQIKKVNNRWQTDIVFDI